MEITDWKEPDFDKRWFKFRADQAIRIYEASKSLKARDQMLDVLNGLFEHAYRKGRHDEKRDNAN